MCLCARGQVSSIANLHMRACSLFISMYMYVRMLKQDGSRDSGNVDPFCGRRCYRSPCHHMLLPSGYAWDHDAQYT